MVLHGHTLKEITRKVKSCIIEDGLTPDECIAKMEEQYTLSKAEKLEIKDIANKIGK